MPSKFDNNIIVIGAGSAGLVSALIAATLKSTVTLIEKHKMGGDCLNTGCVPSKSLIRSARMCAQMRHADVYGINPVEPTFEFSNIMERVRSVIKTIEPHDSVERFTSLGVNCIIGEAEIIGPHTVRVNGEVLSAKRIIIATGARPFVPNIKGMEKINPLTSDNIWDIKELPKKLVILGGGPIGCELAQCFVRFGSDVTMVEMMPRIMIKDDARAASLIHEKLSQEGLNILTNHQAISIEVNNGEKTLVCKNNDNMVRVEFDELLVSVGRKANVENLGLENVGVELNDNNTIKTDEKLKTTIPSIYACGDVAGPYQFTHTASHQAWYASVNALFDKFKASKVDYSIVPWVTFTEPEVAQVGLTEEMAISQGLNYSTTLYELSDLDRAIAESEAIGFVKVLTAEGKDKILGATIVGAHAGEMIPEFILAMKHNLGLNKLLSTIHPYPTWNEANKFAAGVWKRNNAPLWALDLLKHINNWLR